MATVAPDFAQTPSGMQGMQMDRSMPGTQKTKSAQATGVVKAIDFGNGAITVQHQAIASIHWPSMTMTFRAESPALIRSVKVGEKVRFTLHPDGADSTITAISLSK